MVKGKACCKNCQWRVRENITFGYVCIEHRSDHCADWVEDDCSCKFFEEKFAAADKKAV